MASTLRIPQADSVDLIRDLALAVADGTIRDSNDFAEQAGYQKRQGDYYRNAAEDLGLICPGLSGLEPTEKGLALSRAPEEVQRILLADALRETPILTMLLAIIEKAGPGVIGPGQLPSLVGAIADKHGLPLSGATVNRRAQTVAAWLDWLAADGRHIALIDGTYYIPTEMARSDGPLSPLAPGATRGPSIAASVSVMPETPVASTPLSHVPLPRIFAEISKDSKLSVISEGSLPDLTRSLYVKDTIDEQLEAWLVNPSAPPLMILTGSAGHGKSAAITVAREKAQNRGIDLVIRPDATHADRPDETYKEGLLRFLADFRDDDPAPARRGILAMNLGLALRFFGDSSALSGPWQGIAAAFNERFELGLDISAEPSRHVTFLDLGQRLTVTLEKGSATIPFLASLFRRFDVNDPETVTARSVSEECNGCPGANYCPVLVNAKLLSEPLVRQNLTHAIGSAVVKNEIHLTPRLIMDTISNLVVPAPIRAAIDETSNQCNLVEEGCVNPDKPPANTWGERIQTTLFALAFPPYGDALSSDTVVLNALRGEDPCAVRSEEIDGLVLEWASNVENLIDQLHPILRSFLSMQGTKAVAPKAFGHLVSAHRWTRLGPQGREEARAFDDFVRLVTGHLSTVETWTPKLKEALTRVATSAFYEASILSQQSFMAVKMPGLSSDFRILAELGTMEVEIVPQGQTVPISEARFELRVDVPRRDPVRLSVDWKAYSFLKSIADGYAPRPSDPFAETFVSLLGRRLALTSTMEKELFIESRDRQGRLRMRASVKGNNRSSIKVEVRH